MRDVDDDVGDDSGLHRLPDSLSPLPPRAEVKVRRSEVQPLHPAVKYAAAGGGWLGFIGSLVYIWYLVTHAGTRP
jgi:hypothetical protein